MFKSFRGRLLFWFFVFVVMTMSVVAVSIVYFRQKERIVAVSHRVERVYNLMLLDFKILSNFYAEDLNDTLFYSTGQSSHLVRHAQLLADIRVRLGDLRNSPCSERFDFIEPIDRISHVLGVYEAEVDQWRALILERGYKDYGEVGRMRDYAHHIERHQLLQKADILMLRRVEKDYMLRNENRYIVRFSQLCDSLCLLPQFGLLPDSSRQIIRQYKASFLELTNLDEQIGITGSHGLKASIYHKQEQLNDLFSLFMNQAEQQKADLYVQLRVIYGSILFVLIALSVFISLLISGVLTAPLSRLADYINDFVQSNFTRVSDFHLPESNDEIGRLARNFQILRTELIHHVEYLRREKETADRANTSKSRFLANMSHEIRTPLNGVVAMIDVMKRTPINTEQREYLRIMGTSADNLLGIISDILDLSKIESGEMTLEKTVFNLPEILREVLKLFQPRAEEKGLLLINDADRHIPQLVQGDPLRLRQIISNLLSNGIKFTQSGSVSLRSRRINELDDQILMKFEVIDTGVGISLEGQRKLFRPFAQADDSVARHFGGTGLGLAICKDLVQMMGGEIGVVSDEGKGSAFWFTVALTKATSAQLPAIETRAAHFFDSVSTMLLVEDNPINQKVAGIMLGKLGYEPDLACNGKMALDMFVKKKFDIIFMDVQMPVMDGLEAVKRIREVEISLHHRCYIIALTANAFQEDLSSYLEAGFDDCLTKPFTFNQLQFALERSMTFRTQS